VRRILERMQKRGTLACGKVELSAAAVGNVDSNDASDLLTEWLDSD